MVLQQNPTTEENPPSTYADAVQSQDLQGDFQRQVLSMLGGLHTDMQSMGDQVSNLEREQAQSAQTRTLKGKGKAPISAAKSATPMAAELTTESDPPPSPKNWADRDDELMDYNAELVWDDDDDDLSEAKGVKLFKVGEKTEKFLSSAFGSAVSNSTRCQWRDKYGAPNSSKTACPTLDKVIKGGLPAAAKSRNRQLAKQQALLLDVVGPIAFTLEEAANSTRK